MARTRLRAFGYNDFTTPGVLPDAAIGRDQLLNTVMVYWLTRSGGTSAWASYEGTRLMPLGQDLVPTGVNSGGSEMFKRLAMRNNKIIHWPTGNPGRHFAGMEEPAAHAADIRTFFELCARLSHG